MNAWRYPPRHGRQPPAVPDARLERLAIQQPAPPWNAAPAVAIADTNPDRAIALAGEAGQHAEPDFSWLAAQLVAARAVAHAVRRGADERGLLERCTEQLQPPSVRVCWQGTCAYGPVDTTLALLADVGGDTARARRLAHAARRPRGDSLTSTCSLLMLFFSSTETANRGAMDFWLM